MSNDSEFVPSYSVWRHGGWYVDNVRYPSGGYGCVSRNYPDRKWRIVCDSRAGDFTYPNRDAAARAEHELTTAARETADRKRAALLHHLNRHGYHEYPVVSSYADMVAIHERMHTEHDALHAAMGEAVDQ